MILLMAQLSVSHTDMDSFVTAPRHGRSRTARTMEKSGISRRHWQQAASNDAPRALEERTDASRCELQARAPWRLAAALTAGFVLGMHVRAVLCAHRTASAFLVVQMLPNVAQGGARTACSMKYPWVKRADACDA
jgi:hypothetical protein